MINLKDKNYCPTLEEISRYINTPAFDIMHHLSPGVLFHRNACHRPQTKRTF